MPSSSSISTYKILLKRYIGDMDVNKPRLIIKHLRTLNLSPSSIKTIISAIIWAIKEDDDANDALDDYRSYIAKLRGETEKRERDHGNIHGNIPPWEDIINVREKLKEKNEYGRDYILLSLYTYIRPRRLQDFLQMVVVNNEKQTKENDKNYYVIDTGKMIFNVYKTAKSYGHVSIQSPPELHEIINRYVSYHDIANGQPLLGYTNYMQMNYALKRLLGTSVNNIRHSYISKFYSQYNVPSSSELEDMANEMGHSIQTNLRYRKIQK